MVELNEPQVWTLIAVFAASTFAMMGLMSTTFVRILRDEIGGLRAEMNGLGGELRAEMNGLGGELRAEIGGLGRELRAEMNGLRGELRAEIGGLRSEMNARFERVDTQFGRMEDRLDHLDSDVQAITRRVFPE